MFKNKIQQHKIINNQLPLFNLLCLFGTIYLGLFVDYWYFLFLILVVLISLKIKINKWQLLVCLGVCSIAIPLMLFVRDFSLFSKLSEWLKCNEVRNKIFNYLDSVYSKEISSFIKLVLFGVKSSETYIFYKQTVDLGIVWLISVGGFHISLLSRLIYKIFKRIWKVGKWIDFTIILSYSYLLKFSYSSMRVLCMLLFRSLFKKFEIESYNKIGLIGILFFLLNINCFSSYSFMLSFIAVTTACFVQSLEINNKLLRTLLTSVLIFASTIPFVINMNHKISLFTFINSFIFTNIYPVVFIYFLLFAWIPAMATAHYWVIVVNYVIIGNISFNNIFIWSKAWKPYVIFGYYSGFYCLLKLLYLIVYNNKI